MWTKDELWLMDWNDEMKLSRSGGYPNKNKGLINHFWLKLFSWRYEYITIPELSALYSREFYVHSTRMILWLSSL